LVFADLVVFTFAAASLTVCVGLEPRLGFGYWFWVGRFVFVLLKN
jgi:hypothetical protein